MVQQFSSPWLQLISSDGNGYPYGRLRFYTDPGLAPLAVYKDKDLTITHPIEVRADENGVFPQIFMPAGYYTYTVQLHDRSNVFINKAEGLTSPDGATAPASSTDDISEVATTPYTVTTSDMGKLVNYTPAGANIISELPDANDLEDQEVTLRHGGDSHFVVITTNGDDLINGRPSLFLRPGEVVKIKSNGFDWLQKFKLEGRLASFIIVKSRTTETLPATPLAGDAYIGPASSPDEWTQDYINIYDGYSEWHSFAPYEGMTALVLDETINSRPKEYVYFNSSWRVKAVNLRSATFTAETTSGSTGQNSSAATWNQIFFNTSRHNDIEGLSLSGGDLLFENLGKFEYHLQISAFETGETRAGLSEKGDSSTRQEGIGVDLPLNSAISGDVSSTLILTGTFEVGTTGDRFIAELYTELAGQVGKPQTLGSDEVYAIITLREMDIVS